MNARHVLLACPAMRELANAICVCAPEIERGDLVWERFPDGFPNLFLHKYGSLRTCHVSFLMSLDTLDSIFEQVSVLHELVRLGPRSLRMLLPYFPVATMERVDYEGQIPTAEVLAVMLSRMVEPGPYRLVIYDIHALAIRGFFKNSIHPIFKSGTKLLKQRLQDGWQDTAICFPDEGAFKRFRSMFDGSHDEKKYPIIVCGKVRRGGDRRIVTIHDGDVSGRRVVIVDDLVHSGGTMVECKNVLLAQGASDVSMYATHGVMEREAWKHFVDAGFTKVWITDSCPSTAAAVCGIGPFEILSLALSLSRSILD